MRYSGEELRRGLVAAAIDVWSRYIVDEVSKTPNEEITQIFDACGWGRWLRSEEGGGCPSGYTRPPDPDWCGLFVGFCGLLVGQYVDGPTCLSITINPELARKVLPSTYRLASPSHWKAAGVEKPLSVRGVDALPGDVVTVGSAKPQGTHILLVEAVRDDGTYSSIEGNARGILPGGERGRGVVRRERKLEDIQHVYRLDSSHFVEVD